MGSPDGSHEPSLSSPLPLTSGLPKSRACGHISDPEPEPQEGRGLSQNLLDYSTPSTELGSRQALSSGEG